MEWMHEKYLRNQERKQVEALYRTQRSSLACAMGSGPRKYPIQPTENHPFVPIGGFEHHPKESEEM